MDDVERLVTDLEEIINKPIDDSGELTSLVPASIKQEFLDEEHEFLSLSNSDPGSINKKLTTEYAIHRPLTNTQSNPIYSHHNSNNNSGQSSGLGSRSNSHSCSNSHVNYPISSISDHHSPIGLNNSYGSNSGNVSNSPGGASSNAGSQILNYQSPSNQINCVAGNVPTNMQDLAVNNSNKNNNNNNNPYHNLWSKVRHILEENMALFQTTYSSQFPIQFVQIRSHYAEIFEAQPWSTVNPNLLDNDQNNNSQANQIFQDILREMQIRCEKTEEVDQKILLYNLGSYFQSMYSGRPSELVRTVLKCFSIELSILQQNPNYVSVNSNNFQSNARQPIPTYLQQPIVPYKEFISSPPGSQSQINHNNKKNGAITTQNLSQDQRITKISSNLDQLSEKISKIDPQIKNFENQLDLKKINQNNLDNFQRILDSGQVLTNENNNMYRNEINKCGLIESQISSLCDRIYQDYLSLFEELVQCFEVITVVEIRKYTKAQADVYNGAPSSISLEQLEIWVNCLAGCIWRLVCQLQIIFPIKKKMTKIELLETEPPNIVIDQEASQTINSNSSASSMSLPKISMMTLPKTKWNQLTLQKQTNNNFDRQNFQPIYQNIVGMLLLLIKRTLVIEKQPPQVLMKDKRFITVLRHLVSDNLDIHKIPFQIKANLVSDENAKKLMTGKNFGVSGKILNQTCMTEFHEHNKLLQGSFRNMTLRDKGRGDRRGTESVAEEKYSIAYQAEITTNIFGQEYTVTASTLSLPIVIISHGKQEANAAATIFWDNAFSSENRVPFQVPERITWQQFTTALDHKWKNEVKTNVGLSQEARSYLGLKIFNRNISENQEFYWRQLNRDNLPGYAFTFWQWFYSLIELCKSKFVQPHWNQNAVIGFISKIDCQKKLLASQPGTFMLRFSDSKLGSISTAYYIERYDQNLSQTIKEICHLEPDNVKLLQVRSLADTVKDFDNLQFLYPNVPKNEVFSKYYTAKASADGPYVKKTLIAYIDK